LNHTLQHTATHCNTLQHTVIHYNTLQHNGSLQWFELLGRCNEKRLYSAKETFNLKESTTHSDSSCRGGAIRGDQIPSQRLLDFASIDSIESRESSWSAMRGDTWIPSQRLLNWEWKFRGLDWLNRVERELMECNEGGYLDSQSEASELGLEIQRSRLTQSSPLMEEIRLQIFWIGRSVGSPNRFFEWQGHRLLTWKMTGLPLRDLYTWQSIEEHATS